MQLAIIGLILFKVINLVAGTCVLESEFGFILNCNFKKSGLFRVRNLGGLKAHFGLGFSLGDELGLAESIGNLEGNRRRALNYKTGFINKVGVVPKIESTTRPPVHYNHVRSLSQNASSAMTEVMFLPLGVPTFKPIPKLSNNVIRRNDVVQAQSLSATKPPTMFYSPQNIRDRTNNTNLFTPPVDRNSLAKDQYIFNGLRNLTYNRVKEVTYDPPENNVVPEYKNEPTDMRTNSKPYNSNPPPMKYESMALSKKTSKSGLANAAKMMVVMNAPKEYYPSGYDKNFDDNFKSKVDLPPTDFTCAEQKYFPGLYANIDLGCMVFHVCAITDGGIIMKSFLCPESTLFDQTILKCNWWFYVDCNSSTYDSNIPISKSYQLMKSLSYFSNYTKTSNTDKNFSKKL